MGFGRSSQALVAALLLLAAQLALIGVLAGPAGAVDAFDDASFRTAWNTTVGPITINITSDFAFACTGAPTRTVNGDVTVIGNGHTIATCNTQVMLLQNGLGAVNVDALTLTGGLVGIAMTGNGDLTLNASTISGVTDTGGDTASGIFGGRDITLVNSTITGTSATGAAVGIDASGSGNVTLTGSTVANTTGGSSSLGIGSGATVSLTNSTVSGTRATSGDALGIATGTATLVDSTVTTTNATPGTAVGIRSSSTATLVRSTISGISSGLTSTGLAVTLGDASLTNSTITSVGGFAINASGAVTLVYSDVVGNGSTVAVGAAQVPSQVMGSTLKSFASVIVHPMANFQNCEVGTTTTSGYNFADDTTCGFTGTADRQGVGLNAQLGALGANGGSTQTLLPADASPLVDAVPDAVCSSDGASTIVPLTDQRNLPRPGSTACDIGSVELQPVPVVVLLPSFTG